MTNAFKVNDLEKAGVASTAQVQAMRPGRKVQVAGMAIVHHRP